MVRPLVWFIKKGLAADCRKGGGAVNYVRFNPCGFPEGHGVPMFVL